LGAQRAVVESYERVIRELDQPPILMGHSFGGLVVQILLDRRFGSVGVAIDSGAPEGVLTLPPAQARATFPVLRNPANHHRAVPLTAEQFHYAFANTLNRTESDEVYERYHIPAPGRFVWDGVLGNFRPGHHNVYVDFKNNDRAPLLLIGGGKDHLQPLALNESNFKHYKHSTAVTELKAFLERAHYTLGQDGWEEVADYALDWAADHVEPAGAPKTSVAPS
jgi:pimeloyl-ACP methyl ester carboxylesterase